MNRYLPIGIDIQCDGIRALQLAGNGQGLSIKAASKLPMNEDLSGSTDDLPSLKPVMRSLVRRRIFKGRRAVVSLPQDYLHVFPVTIAAATKDTFDSTLAQACSKHLSFPLDQAILDYFCIERMDDGADKQLRVSVVAANREQVHEVIRACKQGGLNVDTIDYGLCGLIRLHNHIHTLTDTPIVLVHMDARSTLLAVAARTNIIAHRQLDWGLDRLHHRIAETLDFDPKGQQPGVMLRDYGVDYDALQDNQGPPQERQTPPDADRMAALRVVSQILVPNMEELVRELFQIIGYARSISPEIQFQEVWLYGMADEIKNLGPFLEKRLRIPVFGMDPFQKLSLNKNGAVAATDINGYIGALGLALREVP